MPGEQVADDDQDHDADYRWSAHIHYPTLRDAVAATAGVCEDAVVAADADGLVVGGTNPERTAGVRATLPADSGPMWDYDPPGEAVGVPLAAADLHAPLAWFDADERDAGPTPDAVTLVCRRVPVGESGRRYDLDVVVPTPGAEPHEVSTYEATVVGYERWGGSEPPDGIDGHATTATVEAAWLADAVQWCAGDTPSPDTRTMTVGYDPTVTDGALVVERTDDRPARRVERAGTELPAVDPASEAVAAEHQATYLVPAVEALPASRVQVELGEHWPLVARQTYGDGVAIEVSVAPWGEEALEALDDDEAQEVLSDDGDE